METAGLIAARREELLARLTEARARTDALFAIVRREALYDRPIPERHRIVFYIGHLEAFDWNLIARRTHGLESFQPAFDQLFAFGIDPVDGQLPNDPPSAWPALPEIEGYVRRVRELVDDCLMGRKGAENGARDDAGAADATVFEVAIEHRLMHAETLGYMLHQLAHDRKIATADPPEPAGRPAAARSIRIPAGTATLGLPRGGGAFGWDNEFERQCLEVPAFSIDAQNVTNGQYAEFMQAGGYERRDLWDDEAWQWKESQRIRHPSFWIRSGNAWLARGMFADTPLSRERPVYVSHAEASAYARWLGKSLPTEAQFHRAAFGTPDGREREYPWGGAAPTARHGNFDFHRWDPTPVGAFPEGDSAFGVADLVGNGWEWTSTVFGPLPGFEAFPFYPGYSANFFDGKHYVLKGGSARTAACMLRRSFRNWFQAHYPFVYASFRCVEG